MSFYSSFENQKWQSVFLYVLFSRRFNFLSGIVFNLYSFCTVVITVEPKRLDRCSKKDEYQNTENTQITLFLEYYFYYLPAQSSIRVTWSFNIQILCFISTTAHLQTCYFYDFLLNVVLLTFIFKQQFITYPICID